METHDRRWQRVWVERGIYLQPNGKYAVRVVIDGRARLRTAATTLEDAREQRALLAEAARRGELPVFPRLTFGEAAVRWLQLFEAKVAVGERRERTLENYLYHLEKHLLPALGRRHLQSITTTQVADLIGDLQTRGLSAKTVAGSLVPLGCVFRFALRKGYIADNPLRRLEPSERPRPVRAERRVLSRAELSRLLASCPTRYRPLLATAAYSGARLSELLGLAWGDVDFGAGVIHLRHQLSRARIGSPARRVAPKTAAAVRESPLAPQLAALLQRHKQAGCFAADCDYVFVTSLGTPLGHRNVEVRALARTAERAGINVAGERRLRFHDLRHTFASHLIVDLRLDVAQVSRILGHASTSITLDTYTHLFEQAAHTADVRKQIGQSEFANLLRAYLGDAGCSEPPQRREAESRRGRRISRFTPPPPRARSRCEK